MKHISIRVPWHDNNWNGSVCCNPEGNPFCMALHNIATKKNVQEEQTVAGKVWSELAPKSIPPCMGENGSFMNNKACQRTHRHVYSSGPHAALLPTEVEIPPYSIQGVPFRYMSHDGQVQLDQMFPNLPPDETAPFKTSWVYGSARQVSILKWFANAIEAKKSLAVFYCKNANPIDEDSSRLIVGLGEVTKVHDIRMYDSTADYTYPLWEILIEHSIRPELKTSKGFLLPYKEYLELSDEEIKDATGKSKNEALDEISLSLEKLGGSESMFRDLSYGCEFIYNQNMLIILTTARKCLEKVIEHRLVGGDWKLQIRWIDDQISKVKNLTGPFPSFAEALRSIGITYAYFIEHDIREHGYCNTKDNPWKAFDKLISGAISLPDSVYMSDMPTYKATWNGLTSGTKKVLELLSRFDISSDIMKEWIKHPDKYNSLLENPYLLSEECSFEDGKIVTTEMIDLGVIEDPLIQGRWIPEEPSRVETKLDKRRIRSMIIYKLRVQLNQGDTLLSIKELEKYVRDSLNKDDYEFPINYLLSLQPFLSEKLEYITPEEPRAIQLKKYFEYESYLRKRFVQRAKKDVKVELIEDWDNLVKDVDGYDPTNERSRSAADDQIRALKMFSKKRLSVLTGPAGTGKTTVVKAFLSSKQIENEGVLLLAPTGKARVRLGNMGKGLQAMTVAQFLTHQGFFNWTTMQAFVPDNAENKKYAGARNVIIDECSMLTTLDFYVLFNALDLKHVNRIILIGDPYQLPPIGPGRPFSDLCNNFKNNEELKPAITQLKTVVRTIKTGDSDILTLASWFAGDVPQKDADGIFDKIVDNQLNKDLHVYTWKDENELKEKLHELLINELPCPEKPLVERIRQSIGMDDMSNAFTNPGIVENFQVLSPVINPVWGTYQINTYFQQWVNHIDKRKGIEIGSFYIHPGDKVIQLINERRKAYPLNQDCLLSNGQIGFTRFVDEISFNKKLAKIAFAGIPRQQFSYYSHKSDEKESSLELAYAITIHKSQGSDFDTVVVVLPKFGRILSRELIYTALTRAKSKLILFVQDNFEWLFEYTKPQSSVLARRNSNLFDYSVREERTEIPHVEGLIHKTKKKGLIVRSKSEVIIANELINRNINFEYERILEEGGHRFLPDFTFEDASGDIIIWEHLGMLDNPAYKASWEKKKEIYKELGFIDGENLFTTRDHENGAFDTPEVIDVIDELEELL